MSQNNNSDNNLIQRAIYPSVRVPSLAPIPTMSTEFYDNLYDSYLRNDAIPGPQIRFDTVAIGARQNTPQHLTRNQQDFIALVPEHLRSTVLAQLPDFSGVRVTLDEVIGLLRSVNNSTDFSNTQCSICFADVPSSDVFTTSCNHSFCMKCIASWVLTKIEEQMPIRHSTVECSCPYCRGVFFSHRF